MKVTLFATFVALLLAGCGDDKSVISSIGIFLLSSFIIGSITCTLVWVGWRILLWVGRHNDKRIQDQEKAALEKIDLFVSRLKTENGLTPCKTHLLLDNDELCFFCQPSALYETKSVRHRQSSGAGVRVMKGVYVGGSKGTSFSVDEWKQISQGTLAITNKRLIFDGDLQNRTVKNNKIIGINPAIGQVEVVVDGRQKGMVFDVPDPIILMNIIRICKKAPDPSNFGDNLKITVDYGDQEIEV